MNRNIAVIAIVLVLSLIANAQNVAVSMISPISGSTLTSTSVTFSWPAGAAGITGYGLNVGTTGVGSADLVNIGPLSGTSVTVKVPANGVTLYVRLWTEALGSTIPYAYKDFTYTESSTETLTGMTCSASLSSTGIASCTITISPAAPVGGFPVTLSSGSAITVPPTVTVLAGATTATFPVATNPITVSAQIGAVTKTATISLTAVVTSYSVNLTWKAPTASSDSVVSYNVLRALNSSTYVQINTKPVTILAFTDGAVTPGATYDYVVQSVDANGLTSSQSNMVVESIP